MWPPHRFKIAVSAVVLAAVLFGCKAEAQAVQVNQTSNSAVRSQINGPYACEEDLIEVMRSVAREMGADDYLLSEFRSTGTFLAQQRRVDDLEHFAEAIAKTMGGTHEAQARARRLYAGAFHRIRGSPQV